MKMLIMILSFMATVSAFAAKDCPYISDDKIVGLEAVRSIEIKMPDAHAKIWLNYFDDELSPKCQAIMTSTLNIMATGDIFYSYTTNEDSCDGGNVYGFLLSSKGEILVEIFDGYPICPGH
jgi:hypothetical protein